MKLFLSKSTKFHTHQIHRLLIVIADRWYNLQGNVCIQATLFVYV